MEPASRTLLLLFFAACAAPPGDSGGPGPEAPTPDPGSPVGPTLSAEEVVQGITTGLGYLDSSGPDLVSALAAAMAAGDPSCPGEGLEMTSTVPPEGCTASTGWWYVGMSSFEETITDDGAELVDNWLLWADLEIRDPEDHALIAGGFVAFHRSDATDTASTNTSLAGTWQWEGATAPGLAGGYSGDLLIDTRRGAEGVELRLQGQITAAGVAMSFEPLVLSPSCPAPAGRVRFRDPTGLWMVFEPGEDCDGCGPVRHQQTELGEACLPAAALDTVLDVYAP